MARIRIPISIEIREALKEIGPGETYDTVIRKLIDLWIMNEIHKGARPITELIDQYRHWKK